MEPETETQPGPGASAGNGGGDVEAQASGETGPTMEAMPGGDSEVPGASSEDAGNLEETGAADRTLEAVSGSTPSPGSGSAEDTTEVGALAPAASSDVTRPQAGEMVETLRGPNGPPEGSDVESGLTGTTTTTTVVLGAGEVLGGNGLPGLDLINQAGTVSPGHSPGVMNVANYEQGPEGTEIIEINGWNANNAPVVYDQFIASGNVTLDGTLKIELSGFTPVVGQTFSILKWGGVRVGEFANYLGTTIATNDQLALVPEYDDIGKELRLRVIDTEGISPDIERALRDIADLAGNLLGISAPGATDLPWIGDGIADILDAKQMV
ncbi:MAG: hypothetical protein AB7J34_12315, partial [Limisphaerales bacterium]